MRKTDQVTMLAVTQEVVASYSRSHIVIGRSDSCIAVVSLPQGAKTVRPTVGCLKLPNSFKRA